MPRLSGLPLALSLTALGAACSPEQGLKDGGQSAPACDASAAAASPAPLRRLTRFEYGRSVSELTGVSPTISLRLPPDEESLGYLNGADAYSVSTLHASKYLELAEEIGETFVADGARLSAAAGCDPLADRACVSSFVSAFGRRAFRRPLRDAEHAALLALYEATSEAGPSAGLSAVVAAVLQSPQFLYRPEIPNGADTVDSFALATRLSYLLVASTPDDALLAAAEDGSLATPEGLEAHTERLLADPRALEAFTHFLSQWWELGPLPTLEKDRALYRGWTSAMPAAFAEELRLFVADAWGAEPNLETLLRAPFTYVDASLASLYGLPIPEGEGFVRVELDPARASGILTQGALLATHAKANQTSPVHRGKFIRSRLFCTPPPPPPPTIVVRPPTVDPRLSTRERFAQHAEDPNCSGCHALMDPIGFGFEHYDAVGRYRDVDGGKPVDARGELLGTDVDGPFEGVPELADRLLQSEEVRTCVATQWFRYAFGRSEQTEADACTIDRLAGELRDRNGDLRAMIRATVKQTLFRAAARAEGGE